jgi:hypothetical protein
MSDTVAAQGARLFYPVDYAFVDVWNKSHVNRNPRARPLGPGADRSFQVSIPSWHPVFHIKFEDPDIEYGDHLSAYEIALFPVNPLSSLRNPEYKAMLWIANKQADTREQHNNLCCCVYDGPPLDPGGVYAWKARVSDAFGAKSKWSDMMFFTCGGSSK